MKKVLVINTGSSSIKYKIFQLKEDGNIEELAQKTLYGIGTVNGPKNHLKAWSVLFDNIKFKKETDEIVAIAHRVVHGGQDFFDPTLVTKDILKKLKKISHLTPLHNPPILEILEKFTNFAGGKISNYAVFDTGFFQDLPEVTKLYPICKRISEKFCIRRYGYHGISHHYSYLKAKERYPKMEKMISIHLGAGSSITAIKNGKVIDTSLGFSTLEGLMMGSRSGDIDPGIILYLIFQGLPPKKVEEILYQQSGLKGISQVSSEMRDILYLAGYKVEDDEYLPSQEIINSSIDDKKKAKLALKMYIYRIKKYLGAYSAILNGVDVISFTGSIGYGSSVIRDMVGEDMSFTIDKDKIFIIKPNEEYQMVKEILPLI